MLFRPEVLAAQKGQWLGSVRLAQSIPVWWACCLAVVLSGSLVVYACLGTYARRAHVPGLLSPVGGEVNVAVGAAGRVTELRVHEGQAVQAGDVLLVLDTDKSALLGAQGGASAETATLLAQQLALRQQGIEAERQARVTQVEVRNRAIAQRLVTLDAELGKLADEVALQGKRRDLAQRSVQRYQDLVASHFVSPIQVQSQQEALLDQDGRLRSLERAKLNLQRERAALVAEEQQNRADLQTTLAASSRDAQALSQEVAENTACRTTVVTAPRAGRVSALSVGTGQWAAAGQTLAALQPQDAPLEAELYAPSRAAGFIEPGQSVLLRYAPYPYQKFGLQQGHVVSVSESAFAPSDLPPNLQSQIGRQTTEALYRVRVALDRQSISTYGAVRPLRAGMALEADIVQERRSIIEWVLEPLFAAAKRA